MSISLLGVTFTSAPVPTADPDPDPDPDRETIFVMTPAPDVGGSVTGAAKLFLRCRGAVCIAPAMDPVPMLPVVLLQGCGVRNSCIGIWPKWAI